MEFFICCFFKDYGDIVVTWQFELIFAKLFISVKVPRIARGLDIFQLVIIRKLSLFLN